MRLKTKQSRTASPLFCAFYAVAIVFFAVFPVVISAHEESSDDDLAQRSTTTSEFGEENIAKFQVTPDDALTVLINDEQGFVPQELTIEQGATVIFHNNGNELHWPISERYPSNTEHNDSTIDIHCATKNEPTFDSCNGIPPGKDWFFTFEKAGTFEYNDHLRPHLTGVITVLEEGSELPAGVVLDPADGSESNSRSIFSRIWEFFAQLWFTIKSIFAKI